MSRPIARAITAWLLPVLLLLPAVLRGAERRPYGGTLAIPVAEAVRTTDPALVVSGAELEMARQLHDSLFAVAPDGVIVPALAHEPPRISANGLEWILELRSEATFHDGSSITSADVVASWERLLRPETGSPHWWLLAAIEGALAFRQGKSTRISGLEVINRVTLRIRLAAPCPRFLEALAALPTAPLSAAWLSHKVGGNPHPPGSGPFSWASGVPGNTLELAAFVGHPRGRPFLDRLQFKTYPNPRAAGLAFELNEVHLTLQPPSRRAGTYQVIEGPTRWLVFLALNPDRVKKLPAGFRQVISRALDRQALVDYLAWGRSIATDEILGSDEMAAPGGTRADPAEAREYFKQLTMQQMGIPPSFVFLVRQGQPVDRAVAERLQINLLDVGATVSLVEVDEKTFATKLAEGSYDFFLEQPLPWVRDPELQWMGVVAQTGGAPALVELQRVLRELPLDDSRSGLVREKARTSQLGLPWIPLFRHDRRAYLREGVHGYSPGATGIADLAEVWLTE